HHGWRAAQARREPDGPAGDQRRMVPIKLIPACTHDHCSASLRHRRSEFGRVTKESPMTDTVQEGVDATIARRNRFLTLNYPRFGITVVEGRGCEFTDSTGRRYLDLFSGFG